LNLTWFIARALHPASTGLPDGSNMEATTLCRKISRHARYL